MTEHQTQNQAQRPSDVGWSDLPWNIRVMKLYEQGAADLAIMKELELTQKGFSDLYNNPQDSRFKELVDYGRTLAKAWWVNLARENLWNKNFKVDLWNAYMRQVYGWNNKADDDGLQIPDEYRDLDSLRNEAYQAFKKLGKRFAMEYGDNELIKALANDKKED